LPPIITNDFKITLKLHCAVPDMRALVERRRRARQHSRDRVIACRAPHFTWHAGARMGARNKKHSHM